ncbi:MAG: metalloregulator ArsR/SmtB family transcription factor [Anaerolineae bacterium]
MENLETYRLPAQILKALAHPARLRILNALRDDEECVCHLTALLKRRQAYVSQHLMFLRQTDLIEDRKEGLRVYYRIKDPRLLKVLDLVNAMAGVTLQEPERMAACSCPRCESHELRQGGEPWRFKSATRPA